MELLEHQHGRLEHHSKHAKTKEKANQKSKIIIIIIILYYYIINIIIFIIIIIIIINDERFWETFWNKK